MSQINVTNLTFGYESSFDFIFEQVSFCIDTDWKLGFIGRNGKGKTTFLNLLCGRYEYQGTIHATTVFDYFPYEISGEQEEKCAYEFLSELKKNCEEWRVMCELDKLDASSELLYQPFHSLSHGERTKVLLAVLFSGENDFLLIDEPTNHLDKGARDMVKQYLQKKKGFILVSHDRDLLDACIDHVLVLNKKTIEVQTGNFSSWWENKTRKDHFSKMENEKHEKEISVLKKSARQVGRWANKSENRKIGFDPVKEHDRCIATRSYIGAKTKKMEKKAKHLEQRIEREIREKEGLLQDVEKTVNLKIQPLHFHKERLILAKDICVGYPGKEQLVLDGFHLELMRGERVFLNGKNGCGKSTLLKLILTQAGVLKDQTLELRSGTMETGASLVISYVNQDTSFLQGEIKVFCKERGLDESLLFTLLQQMGLERVQFSKHLEELSEGQKKKVLIAASLITPAHLYIWDEPLNYIDVFTRMQIEELILKYQPTMILVDHDVQFREKIATRIIEM